MEYLSSIIALIDSNPVSYIGVRVMIFLHTFFALYVVTTGLYRAKLQKRLKPLAYFLGFPWLLLMAIADFVANVTVFAVMFLEPPKEFLVTSRLRRHLRDSKEKSPWRYKLAKLVCDHVLDYFDPRGSHCFDGLGPD